MTPRKLRNYAVIKVAIKRTGGDVRRLQMHVGLLCLASLLAVTGLPVNPLLLPALAEGPVKANSAAKPPAKAKPLQGGASVRKPPPAGMVYKEEALKKIATLQQQLEQARANMMAKYDYAPSVATLENAFRQNGVRGKAMGYTDAWGQNGLYLTWDVANRFYKRHHEALSDSARSIRNSQGPFVRQGDIQYLEQGVRNWQSHEQKVQQLFSQRTTFYGQQAAILDRRFEVADRKFKAPYAEHSVYDAQIEELSRQAEAKRTQGQAVARQITEIGYNTRVFSAINAPDRIALEPLKEALQEPLTQPPANTTDPCEEISQPNRNLPVLQIIPEPVFRETSGF